MSELREFVRWASQVRASDMRDQFGVRFRDHAPFPAGQVAWWIAEYERAKGQP